jgi:hypothetical protein
MGVMKSTVWIIARSSQAVHSGIVSALHTHQYIRILCQLKTAQRFVQVRRTYLGGSTRPADDFRKTLLLYVGHHVPPF